MLSLIPSVMAVTDICKQMFTIYKHFCKHWQTIANTGKQSGILKYLGKLHVASLSAVPDKSIQK
jgi:hypothetical protein